MHATWYVIYTRGHGSLEQLVESVLLPHTCLMNINYVTVTGSATPPDVMREYMHVRCGQENLVGWP